MGMRLQHPFGPPIVALPHMALDVYERWLRQQTPDDRMKELAKIEHSLPDAQMFESRKGVLDNLRAMREIAYRVYTDPFGVSHREERDMTNAETFPNRLRRIASEIELGMQCDIRVSEPSGKGAFVQIRCWRQDTITKKMGYGYGGKAYLREHATDSEIIQMIFGLYKAYWEHEARETFIWRGRRPFGPHISTEALWEVARRVDVRSQRHVEDNLPPQKDLADVERIVAFMEGQSLADHVARGDA